MFSPRLLFLLPAAFLLASCTTTPTAPTAPSLVTAEQWGSSPQPLPDEMRHTPRQITIHHAGTVWPEDADATQSIRNLQSWGQGNRDWPDLPYHYLIEPGGTIYEGRSTQYVPETNTSYDVEGHIGVQLWGNFEEQRVVEPQLEALVDVVAWLCETHSIDPATISGHKDVAPGTLCPGRDFYRYIEQGLIEKWVEEKMAGKSPSIELLPPLEDGPTDWIPVPASQIEMP